VATGVPEAPGTPGGRRRSVLAGAAALAVILASGCGKKGPPLPPLPRGPLPPRAVAARQIGMTVIVEFEGPEPRGPKPAQRTARAELVRVAFAPGLQPPVDPDSFRRRGEVVDRTRFLEAIAGTRVEMTDSRLGELADGGMGATLRYAVRLRDGKGRPSPLVMTTDLVPLPPRPAPRGLAAEPTGDGMRLVWQPVEAPDDLEPVYNVYRARPASPWPERPLNPEPIAATEYLDSGVEIGLSYVYAVRVALAVEPPYREGASSEALEVVAEDRFAPAVPEGLVAVQEGPAVRLFWDPNDERDLAGYMVYRSVDGGEWTSLVKTAIEQAQFLDTDVRVGERLGYRVTAIDRASPTNESDASEIVEVDLLVDPAAPGGGQ